jgi:DNA uptake protein ComE-like DNA-binding protein
MALPFFPAQQKLLKKIENLKAKIQAKNANSGLKSSAAPETRKPIAPFQQLPTPASSFQEEEEPRPTSRKGAAAHDEDASFVVQEEAPEDDEDFLPLPRTSSKAKKSKSSKSTTKLQVFADEAPQTPRTKHLLDIVNSRDVTLIKGLCGVGAKKARDVVEFLELQNEDDGGLIKTLGQLRAVPGLGTRTVERAYEGIGLLV